MDSWRQQDYIQNRGPRLSGQPEDSELSTQEAILILAEFFRRFQLEAKALVNGIPLKRNVIFTSRPVGVTARIRPVGSVATTERLSSAVAR